MMALMALMATTQKWDEHLHYITMALRPTPLEMSQNMMFGREHQMPVDIMIVMPKEEGSIDEQSYVKKLRANLMKHIKYMWSVYLYLLS